MANVAGSYTDSPVLWLGFEGPELQKRAVPIQELGETLVAVQRVLHKAYLFNQGRLTITSVPRAKERREIGLQLAGRRQGSDVYQLVPLINDPLVQSIIGPLIVQMIGALTEYSKGKVQEIFKRTKKPATKEEPREEILLGIIYPQVRNITRRIGKASGIERVKLYAEDESSSTVVLDTETKKLVRSVGRQQFFGDEEVLVGRVRSLWFDDFIAVIERQDGYDIKVRMPENEFETLRQEASRKDTVEFDGRPVFRLGVETLIFREFQATKVRF